MYSYEFFFLKDALVTECSGNRTENPQKEEKYDDWDANITSACPDFEKKFRFLLIFQSVV